MSEELPGCPSKIKAFGVCACVQEQKYKKNCAERVVDMALRMFLLSFSIEATGDRMRTLPVLGVFSLSFQAKRSVLTS